MFCKKNRLDLVQSITDPGENLVLDLTIDSGRHITSTKGLERQREKPQYIPCSGDDVCRSRFPQDRRTEAKDSHYVLYAIIEKLAEVQRQLGKGEGKKRSTLPATSAPEHCTMVATKLASSRVKE